jgi:hypothetical protein
VTVDTFATDYEVIPWSTLSAGRSPRRRDLKMVDGKNRRVVAKFRREPRTARRWPTKDLTP